MIDRSNLTRHDPPRTLFDELRNDPSNAKLALLPLRDELWTSDCHSKHTPSLALISSSNPNSLSNSSVSSSVTAEVNRGSTSHNVDLEVSLNALCLIGRCGPQTREESATADSQSTNNRIDLFAFALRSRHSSSQRHTARAHLIQHMASKSDKQQIRSRTRTANNNKPSWECIRFAQHDAISFSVARQSTGGEQSFCRIQSSRTATSNDCARRGRESISLSGRRIESKSAARRRTRSESSLTSFGVASRAHEFEYRCKQSSRRGRCAAAFASSPVRIAGHTARTAIRL